MGADREKDAETERQTEANSMQGPDTDQDIERQTVIDSIQV